MENIAHGLSRFGVHDNLFVFTCNEIKIQIMYIFFHAHFFLKVLILNTTTLNNRFVELQNSLIVTQY